MRFLISLLLLVGLLCNAAPMNAGDHRWEEIDRNDRMIIYRSLDTDRTTPLRYDQRVMLRVDYLVPDRIVVGEDTYLISHRFVRGVMVCSNRTAIAEEEFIFEYPSTALLDHVTTRKVYTIMTGSPLDKIWSLSCTQK
ncbi:hypothetical protein [Chitinilyticum piscinae]|uniref:Uncharacterized protein n=1 Tax=Chitinilyticum piscinae TaxID=2866724 RepID=A0A8J7K9B7_9NEIS|nr:hypothetical protein [Chitinilyticum piscinae]MBE9611038.1 hypothetical protein [Chitinilyticum piscinae]